MRVRSEETSREDSGGRDESSEVYDFLYYDTRRIGSFLAQLGQYGTPGRLTHRQSSGENSREVAGSKLGGGAPGVASGEASNQVETATQYAVSLDQEYDPLWISGLNLYDLLHTRRLIKTNLASASIGDFVDVTGALSVVDFTMFRTLWQQPSVQGLIQVGIDQARAAPTASSANRHERRRDQTLSPRSRTQAIASATTGNLVGDILSALPHPVLARFMTEGHQSIWSSLRADSLLTEAADVFLKHGVALDGRWRMFGVLDALPSGSAIDELKAAVIEDFGAVPFGQMALGMMPLMQSGFARSDTAWGVTPIMIFREINAR